MNVKEAGAKKALEFIQDGMIVGLGGGRTIAYLTQYLANSAMDIKVVTPSFETEQRCVALGLNVLPLRMVSHVDIAFDGCDEVDHKLNALKSGGGIHTKEKLIANMADQYVLIVDETKVSEHLTFQCPVVLEVLEDAYSFVQSQLKSLNGEVRLKTSSEKYGPLQSDYGNPLIDVFFKDVVHALHLNHQLKRIAGVIDTSLLTREVTRVVIAKEDGSFRILEKEEDNT